MRTINFGLAAMMLVVMIGSANAQDTNRKEEKRLARLEKKELKALALQESKAAIEQLVQNRSILLEADALYGRYSYRWNVTTNNFIAIDGDKMILQTASPYRIGYNGLGGITLEGRITDYKVSDDKEKGPLVVTVQVSTPRLGSGTVRMNIGANGNASATFSDVWGHRITFSGKVEDPENVTVFEGMRL